MSQELQDYIAQARKVGKSDEEITKELLDKGWKLKHINKNLHQKLKTPSPTHTADYVFKFLKTLGAFVFLLFVAIVMFGFCELGGCSGKIFGLIFLSLLVIVLIMGLATIGRLYNLIVQIFKQ